MQCITISYTIDVRNDNLKFYETDDRKASNIPGTRNEVNGDSENKGMLVELNIWI